MMMGKQRYISGYVLNQKHFFLAALKSWRALGKMHRKAG
jgi:hypothetical protein